MRRAAVGQVVAINGSNHSVRQIQMSHSLSDVTRFLRVKLPRRAFANCAKAAMARANIATQHKCRRPISPALENVWAFCFLANRVQVKSFNQLEQMILVRRIAQTDPEPFGLWLTWFGVKDVKFAGQFLVTSIDEIILASAG
jgi:hypothetical protein